MVIDLSSKVYLFIPEGDAYYIRGNKYVLHVIMPQPQGSIGGADTHVLQLASQQKKSSAYTPIVLFNRNRDYEKRLRDRKLAYISGINASNQEIADAMTSIHLFIDIVMIHSHQYGANFLTVDIKKKSYLFMEIPTVMTCHGWIENNEKDILETKKDFDSYKFADALITVCQKDLTRLRHEQVSAGKMMYCINNGVEILSHYPTVSEILNFKYELGIGEESKVIGYVGRLAFEKRLDLIIAMFSVLLKKRTDCFLLIAGSGDERDRLEALSRSLGIDNNVIFLGYMNDPTIVYRAIDLLILMSMTEGTPRCVLECMSCGRIAVATNVGDMQEIIETGTDGLILDNNEINQTADKINELLENYDRVNKMNRNAKLKIQKYFSIDRMQKKIEQVYDNVLTLKSSKQTS